MAFYAGFKTMDNSALPEHSPLRTLHIKEKGGMNPPLYLLVVILKSKVGYQVFAAHMTKRVLEFH